MIDAHLHFWQPERGDYGWLQPGNVLHRPYLPADLLPLMTDAGVEGCIVVQAAPTPAETDFLLDLATTHPFIRGVVGWLDLSSADAVADIAARARNPRLVGIRPMLQDLDDPRWILRADVVAGLRAMADSGLVFDALVRAEQVDVIESVAEQHPGLVIVLDHAGKPPFGQPEPMQHWARKLRSLAGRRNVHCKLSGLLTELPEGAPVDEIHACIDLLIDMFGDGRLMWGSDWPVATLATSYSAWLELCRARIAARAPEQAGAIFGETAKRIYRLPTTSKG